MNTKCWTIQRDKNYHEKVHTMGEMQATLDDFDMMHYCLGEFNDQARGASQILSIA